MTFTKHVPAMIHLSLNRQKSNAKIKEKESKFENPHTH